MSGARARSAASRVSLTTVGGTGAFSLVQVMNELIALGIGLTDVIRMVTVNAATMRSGSCPSALA